MTILLGAALAQGAPVPASRAQSPTVVFVCEHGTVKSVIAMQWFNKMAQARGLEVRAVARGVTPDAAVPAVVSDGLRDDGLALETFTPTLFTKDDLARAARVIAIGADTSSVTSDARVPVDVWSDIPPATKDYPAAREAMRLRIERLLTDGVVQPTRP